MSSIKPKTNAHHNKGFTPTPMNIGVSSQREQGFTLIELLVVISIISLVTSVILASLNDARARARDAALLADTKSLVNALALYYNDHGYYPPYTQDGANGSWWGMPRTGSIKGNNTNATFKDALAPYMPQLPNPGMVSAIKFKAGMTVSRISYMRPYAVWPEFQGSCGGAGGWGETGYCYSLVIITETNTPLGPANTPIALINGVTPYRLDNSYYDTYWTWWGFY